MSDLDRDEVCEFFSWMLEKPCTGPGGFREVYGGHQSDID